MANTNNNKSLNVPILRFKEFSGEWKECTLGDITINFNLRNKEKIELPMYSVTNNRGFIPQSEQFEDRDMVGENIKAYKIIHNKDFAYNPARINVGSIAKYSGSEPCMISSLYVCFKAINGIDEDWLMHLLRSPKIQYYYQINGEGGVRIYLFYPNFARIRTSFPTITEQRKIANLLSLLDARISTQNKIIEDLKKLKSAFLKKLLQGKEWNKYYIRNLAEVKGGGTPSSSNTSFWSGNIPWVSSSDISEENIYDVSITRYITDEAIDNSATKICEAPCVLIVSRVGVGKVALSNMPLCTSQDFCNLVKIKCNPMFLAYQLSLIMKRKAKEVQGTSIKGITIDEIQKIEVFLPNKKEQNQIASKLSNVDNLISVETKFLQCYQKQRTYLLQQLFI